MKPLALGLFLLVFLSAPARSERMFYPDDAVMIGLGKLIYDAQCASCHGANLEGAPNWRVRNEQGRLPAPPHDETGHTWHHPERQLFEITKHGLQRFAGPDYESDMPAYEEILTDAEIIAVLSYIKSTWPARIRARHDAMSQ
jgi:mono/diheme cytochrome c family protein